MAFIEQIEPDAAEGLLKKIFSDSIARAGKVWNIVKISGINPRITRAHLGFYASIMKLNTSMTPRMRETLAVVVSRANACFY
jgi:alkylhydroperoxidase family enzyme